ncbi:hypothetical protein D0C36_15820 [Mucilaginibacter conchicola]|uniref:Uncharacterized protein n=1 Tax=Mucilaginibacter conchicola TaxID=2303333 RepID=A0A372NUC6_9SPHI|nr:hypothetical protein [Mucilaginibacter conchicola]RFZ92858.1 hypothetical protein D0C36_15820 [Mucilaginibacter conchicola]
MDKNMLVTLTALAGLAGALLSQLMIGFFAYINDNRKKKDELEKEYRNKKAEIGENFCFINAELMTMMRKNIDYWENLGDDRSGQTLAYMRREMERLDNYQAQLKSGNWKYNLINIYFDLPFDIDAIQQANRRSHQLYIRVIDLSDKLRTAEAEAREMLYPAYNMAVFELCGHYETVYKHMQENMTAVRGQLLATFGQTA